MQVKVIEQDIYGNGVAKIDNIPIFIEKALPNEIVDINIKEEKKNYKKATINNIIEQSQNRIEPLCQYYNECGGCNLLHQDYNDTLNFKLNKVKNNLKKIGNIDYDIKNIISDERYNYRNKITLHVKNNIIGLYKDGTNNIIDINKCIIANNTINEIISKLKKYNMNNIKEITIRVSEFNNESLLIINYNHSINKTVQEMIKDRIANNIVICNKDNYKVMLGNDYITEKLTDKIYQISAQSFFQVNTKIACKAYELIKSYIDNKIVLDLYCGTGSIGIYISDKAKKVIGIEEVSSSIENVNINKDLNNTNNIEFILGKVEDNIKQIKQAETVILDPPRAGTDSKTLNTILELKPEKIIYMSCDSATLARDLKLLEGYIIKDITVLDMFPNTHHVETIVLLEK